MVAIVLEIYYSKATCEMQAFFEKNYKKLKNIKIRNEKSL